MNALLLNLDRINKDRIKHCITINQVIDCGFMCVVNYTIADCIYSKDLYYRKPYARDVDMLLHELRTGGIPYEVTHTIE